MTTKGKFLYFCKAIESGWIRKYLETMKTKWFSLLLVLLIAACQSNEIKYIDYHNERFGFDLSYPEFMTMDPPSANGEVILTLLLTYKQGEVDEKIIKTILEKFQHENVKI